MKVNKKIKQKHKSTLIRKKRALSALSNILIFTTLVIHISQKLPIKVEGVRAGDTFSRTKAPLRVCAMDFHTATEKAKAFTKRPTDEEFLEFYGLYKQATVGDVNVERPGALDLKGKAKWDSWNKHKGLSKAEAEKAYIATYEKYAPKYA